MYSYIPSVPWVPTRDEVVEALLRLLRLRRGDVFYDVGCGDGKIAVAVAGRFPEAVVKCVEIRKDLVEKARAAAEEKRVKVEIINADFFAYRFSDADVLYMYLLTSVNQKLRPKLEEELRPGTVVITLDFPMTGWSPVAEIELPRSWQRVLYVYVVGYSDAQGREASLEALRRGLERLNPEALPREARERIEELLAG